MRIKEVLELRLAFRGFRKHPIVTLTTLFALTVGIGMATTGFTLLDALVLSKLPFANGEVSQGLEVLTVILVTSLVLVLLVIAANIVILVLACTGRLKSA